MSQGLVDRFTASNGVRSGVFRPTKFAAAAWFCSRVSRRKVSLEPFRPGSTQRSSASTTVTWLQSSALATGFRTAVSASTRRRRPGSPAVAGEAFAQAAFHRGGEGFGGLFAVVEFLQRRSQG
jgi:hypothetical protein